MLTQKQAIAALETKVSKLEKQIQSLIDLIGADSIESWDEQNKADLAKHREDQQTLNDYLKRTGQAVEGGPSCLV